MTQHWPGPSLRIDVLNPSTAAGRHLCCFRRHKANICAVWIILGNPSGLPNYVQPHPGLSPETACAPHRPPLIAGPALQHPPTARRLPLARTEHPCRQVRLFHTTGLYCRPPLAAVGNLYLLFSVIRHSPTPLVTLRSLCSPLPPFGSTPEPESGMYTSHRHSTHPVSGREGRRGPGLITACALHPTGPLFFLGAASLQHLSSAMHVSAGVSRAFRRCTRP